ncbi:MAG TPA: diacylglycerol kinase family protein [Vicinamibacterales bacterium]|nr:diacylglycerol kinase family protein [Vicinamibacterales bacterium]
MEAASRHGRIVEVILNSQSGTLDKHALAGTIESFLAHRDLTPRVHVTASGNDVPRLARQAASSDAEIVVAGGGDGTSAAVAERIAGTEKAFGVLPLGTFNYFAKDLGIPLELDGALNVLANGVSASIDVGEVNGYLFLNNSSVGLYPALLAKRETTYRQFGRSQLAAYLSALLVLIEPPRFLNLTIRADGHPLARRTPLLFIGTNASQMDSFGIVARECLASRKLTLYVTHPLGGFGLLRLALRAFVRGLRGAREFEVICAEEILVGMRRRQVRVAMDGEVRVLETPLRYRIQRGALRVLVPAVALKRDSQERERVEAGHHLPARNHDRAGS